jgi:hypothetical protein
MKKDLIKYDLELVGDDCVCEELHKNSNECEYCSNPCEEELIKYVLELVGDDDCICEELHKNSNECEYCSKHCSNLNENCVRRLMYNRIINAR